MAEFKGCYLRLGPQQVCMVHCEGSYLCELVMAEASTCCLHLSPLPVTTVQCKGSSIQWKLHGCADWSHCYHVGGLHPNTQRAFAGRLAGSFRELSDQMRTLKLPAEWRCVPSVAAIPSLK